MNNTLDAVKALIDTYQPNPEFNQTLESIFNQSSDFLTKVSLFDEAFAKHPAYSEVEEYAFDLLMTHHLANFNDDEDYFDSKEWQDIEDKTIERGTELLNMLLYISEANDNDVAADLEDFLYDFLLVDEDEFQDEHRIYEELIANQDLIDEDDKLIVEVQKRLPDSEEIKELFTPFMLYFKHAHAHSVPAETAPLLNNAERAVLQALLTFANG